MDGGRAAGRGGWMESTGRMKIRRDGPPTTFDISSIFYT